MKRYEVTYFDDFTGRKMSIEYMALTKGVAKKMCRTNCGNVEIIDVRKVA